MGTAILAAVVVMVAAGFVVYFTVLPRWGRTRELEKRASALGLHPETDHSVLEGPGLPATPWRASTGAKAENILRGEVRGAEIIVFDCVQGDGRRVPDTVVFFRPRGGRLPEFELRPREPKDPRGLDFESNPRFSEIYALTGSDEGAVRAVFRRDVLEFFERGENQSWAVTSTGEWLALSFWPLGERTRPLHPKEVMGFIEDAKEVFFVLS